ncbi:MAG: hypothetical protein F9K35_16325, partial [Burkholderiaceae bacterium]
MGTCALPRLPLCVACAQGVRHALAIHRGVMSVFQHARFCSTRSRTSMPPPSHSLRTRRNRLWRTATPGLLALLAAFAAHAQVTFTGTYTQNFDTLASSGTGNAWANNSTLPGWFLFNKTPSAIIAYDAGDGGGNTGKFYSFGTGTSTDRALGGLASGGAYFGSPAIGSAAGWIAFAATNATGAPVHGVTVKF